MPPNYTDLSRYQYVIWLWYILENHTIENVRIMLQTEYPEILLLAKSNSKNSQDFPSKSTLERALKSWGFRKNKSQMLNLDPMRVAELQTRLWTFFYEFGLSDINIQLFLQQEGYDIEMKVMIHIRLSLGMRRRTE